MLTFSLSKRFLAGLVIGGLSFCSLANASTQLPHSAQSQASQTALNKAGKTYGKDDFSALVKNYLKQMGMDVASVSVKNFPDHVIVDKNTPLKVLEITEQRDAGDAVDAVKFKARLADGEPPFDHLPKFVLISGVIHK